jgi:branched-chain amino acid transport system ATP-binding protein
LEVKNTRGCFGGLAEVNELDFKVSEGEMSELIGQNGVCKSTVFNLITSYYKLLKATVVNAQ